MAKSKNHTNHNQGKSVDALQIEYGLSSVTHFI